MPDDEGAAAEKRKRELKGDIDYKFIQFDDLPREFGEGVEGVYVQPVIHVVGGLTTADKPGSLIIDAANRLETVSSPYGIGSGGIRSVSGTFTKDASGTVGSIAVWPDADDILYFMYGYVIIGATKAGAGVVRAGIYTDAPGAGGPAGSEWGQLYLNDAGANASEKFFLPALGEVNTAVEKTSGVYNPLQHMIPGANHITEDGGATLKAGNPAFMVDLTVMANTETFSATLFFFSMNDSAITIADYTGAWA